MSNNVELSSCEDRVQEALSIAIAYGGVDGSHHKDWVIDQMVRVLTGPEYDEVVLKACGGDLSLWDCGIAP